ncbi:hydrogen peroxide-inducible genes activator [Simiduia aestuariiviva]|uniref:LysR family hydrogen peroxide-inducible transcriptional activator n=1 Tax=Simiduia aestuariiviva TaxID=1510459 RepID=A0A839UP35_9GAMM|nr:hydrogen peroxide-inducible genes activator [Simiduia aestuariiviva]MBB3167516.1 LysR family hydrogen peroxide-inducible transcriptional activator [Simiduia aestuariiviva]
MISLKQLTYALAVEKTLHFKRAAEACHVSQSALSTALTELEKQLGVQIFERDNKRVLVTPLGQEVLRRAQGIVQQTRELERLADIQKAPLSYPMSVGLIPTIGPYLLPKILSELNAAYPAFSLSVVEEQSHQLVDMVRTGEIDTAVLALPFPHEGLLAFEFWEEDFYWVAHKSQVKSNQREIASRELDQAKLMLLKEGHCLKDHILEACKLGNQTANHGFGATSLNTLIQMVIGQLGTTLVPAMALESLIAHNDQLSAVHLKEPSPHRRIAFIVRPNYSRLASVEALMAVCKSALMAR